MTSHPRLLESIHACVSRRSTPIVEHALAGAVRQDENFISALGEGESVPTISAFYGILIQMFWQEHAPPHFHALYGEYEVLIDIRTLEVTRGAFPRRALSLVLEWASLHREELMENWSLCETRRNPNKIPPLE